MVKFYVVTLEDPVSELCRQNIAGDAGVYFVFAATAKINAEGRRVFALRRLLYIGRSNDVNRRVNGQHHRHDDILAACVAGECPCYYYGQIEREDDVPCRENDFVRVESALIFEKKPLLNDTADRTFHHELTVVSLTRSESSMNRNPLTHQIMPLPVAFGETLVIAI